MNNAQAVFSEIMGDSNELYTQNQGAKNELCFIELYSRDELGINLTADEVEKIHVELEHCLYAGRDFTESYKNLK